MTLIANGLKTISALERKRGKEELETNTESYKQTRNLLVSLAAHQYQIERQGKTVLALDPYAKSSLAE